MADIALTMGQLKPRVHPDTVHWIADSKKVKVKDSQKISFFQILSCLDGAEVAVILADHNYPTTAAIVVDRYVIVNYGKDDVVTYADWSSGFDFMYPYDQRRDFLIKKWMAKEDTMRG
jgi:ABC-type cobalamin transport system ATPase subunit